MGKINSFKRNSIITILAFLLLILSFIIIGKEKVTYAYSALFTPKSTEPLLVQNFIYKQIYFKPVTPLSFKTELTISAAGDVTIGSDDSFGYHGTFHHEMDNQGAEFFGKNIKSIFENDNLSIVNLETTLTDSNQKASKKFRFKGKPDYAEILTSSNIEAVNLANNHTFDYLQKGYDDTIANLEKHQVDSFGYDRLLLKEIKGITVGAIGYKGWIDSTEVRETIEKDIATLRDGGAQVIIANFHWGDERQYHPNATQQALGRFAIDAGADLVLGHHPHVVQGVENYKNRFIVYSLGNFMFGGNRNPSDKDTFIFQQTFHFSFNNLTNKKDIKIIPTSISSTTARNNYQPTCLEGEHADRVINKILTLSENLNIDDRVPGNTYALLDDVA